VVLDELLLCGVVVVPLLLRPDWLLLPELGDVLLPGKLLLPCPLMLEPEVPKPLERSTPK